MNGIWKTEKKDVFSNNWVVYTMTSDTFGKLYYKKVFEWCIEHLEEKMLSYKKSYIANQG